MRSEIAIVLLFCACGQSAPKTEKAAPPASVSKKVGEGDLARVTLTPEAEARIAIATAIAEERTVPRVRTLGGDVVPSTGRSLVVVAPVSGTVLPAGGALVRAGQTLKRGEAVLRLVPVATIDRDLRAQAQRAVASAEARLAAAEARVARTEKLLAEGAAAARTLEEARADRDVAKADLDAARARLAMVEKSPLEADVAVTLRAPEEGTVRAVTAAAGAMVAAGAPLFEVVGTSGLWIKVTIFVGDLRLLRADAPARVRSLTAPPAPTDPEALPVHGPLTSDAQTATFDLYYALPKSAPMRPGERVAVTLAYAGDASSIAVPWASVVRDVRGDAWVYEVVGDHTYERRRVEIDRVEGDVALVTRGLRSGAKIVVAGAAELFGTEFGAGK